MGEAQCHRKEPGEISSGERKPAPVTRRKEKDRSCLKKLMWVREVTNRDLSWGLKKYAEEGSRGRQEKKRARAQSGLYSADT